ncbi:MULTISPECIES: CHAD domain-containing protein [unclassified Ensifer]|uniref:CYTH and CHAD domain-containing protein n=1 Tax=unclassified Ensifer TaxID=2633371 RepID=UPI000812EFC8|nr:MULTISPECIES: CHAD domain-containing protein [unclassified Ensifer]OCP04474.1 metal-binding protein [Ensifer sp. LC11]OCP04671.1 metal-binding protein [Ensifer sp. LC13]OCP13333.1 metal-binding protein [Ensifer sp. LC14]OCP30495.1 metal-binding protein [Ensifer sp. LC499]
MNTEIELKLELSPDDLDRFEASGLLGEPASVEQQRSVYFDTRGRDLFQSGFTLRIRTVGAARTQTIKATGPSASVYARPEWEQPLVADEPVVGHTTPLAAEFDLRPGDLEPQFTVEVERTTWDMDQDGTRIEAVLDRGAITSGSRRTAIGEIELELKGGDPQALFTLARRIEAVVPIRFGVMSKAERGFRLIDAQQTVFKAEPVELDREMRVTTSFRTIALACLRHFRLNEDVLRMRQNPEALHQARVALRRLRSAVSLYRDILQDDESQRIKGELKWLAGEFGKARDVDVLLTREPEPELFERLQTARAARYVDVFSALDGARGRALLLDLHEWLHCGAYQSTPPAELRDRSAVDFAEAVLDRERRKLKKHGRALAKVSDEERHEARKDAKKLRYAAEFFAALFDDKRGVRRHKRFISAMTALQDQLGTLNDLVSGPLVLGEMGLEDHPDAETLTVHADKGKLIDRAQGALDDVIDVKRFWR